MEQLIKFRALSDELQDNEYNQFIMQSIKSQGRNLFNTFIFNAFKNRPEAIAPFTNIMTNIINSRESTPNIEISYDCLDTLPSVLIAECASFLEYSSYFSFGKVNRKIYCSIYSPSKIHTISRILLCQNSQQIDMKKFKNVKKASIYIRDFNKLSTVNRSIWKTTNYINSLDVYNNSDQQTVDQFFDKNDINLENIRKLQIVSFDEMSLESFLKLISKFPMLEYLGLDEVYIDENEDIASFNNDIIRMNLEKLKGLSIDDASTPNLGAKLINALSDQLEALSICDSDNIIISNQKFPKLTELRLYEPNIKLLDSFKNVTTIKTAYLEHWDQEKVTQQFIKQMIENQLYLKQLKVETDFKNVAMTLETVETSLIWTKDQKRESDELFIEFILSNFWGESEKELMKKIYVGTIKLLNALEITKIKHWRIKIKMDKDNNTERESDGMKKWLNELEHLKKNYLIHYEFTKNVMFVISNKGCKICGYQQNSCFIGY